MNREIHNILEPRVALTPRVISSDTTTNGAIIDTQGFDSLEFYLQTGVLTDGDYTVLIQEGDESDLSDASAVADADLTTTEADASFTADTDDGKVSRIGYTGNKRYVRLNVVSTSTSTGAYLSALAILGHPSIAPVAANG